MIKEIQLKGYDTIKGNYAKLLLDYHKCTIYYRRDATTETNLFFNAKAIAGISFQYVGDGCYHFYNAYVNKEFRNQGLFKLMNKLAVELFKKEQSEITIIAKISKTNENKKYVEKVLKDLGFTKSKTKTHIYMMKEIGI